MTFNAFFGYNVIKISLFTRTGGAVNIQNSIFSRRTLGTSRGRITFWALLTGEMTIFTFGGSCVLEIPLITRACILSPYDCKYSIVLTFRTRKLWSISTFLAWTMTRTAIFTWIKKIILANTLCIDSIFIKIRQTRTAASRNRRLIVSI